MLRSGDPHDIIDSDEERSSHEDESSSQQIESIAKEPPNVTISPPSNSPKPNTLPFSLSFTPRTRKQTDAENVVSPRSGRLSFMSPRRLSMLTPRRLSNLKHTVEPIRMREENHLCADCTERNPTWASTNLGVFICTQCAGVHRSLGTHVSKVLSCKLDKWQPAQIKFMGTRGNEEVNEEYEFYVPVEFEKPRNDDKRELRERYITAKYVEKRFVQANAPLSSSGKPTHMPPRIHARTPARPKGLSLSPSKGLLKKTTSVANQQGMVLYTGMLTVEIKHADSLDLGSRWRNLYCKAKVGMQKVRSQTQTIASGESEVVWAETLMVCCSPEEPLVVAVWAKDKTVGVPDHHIGTSLILVDDVPTDKAVDLTVPLRSRRSLEPVAWQLLETTVTLGTPQHDSHTPSPRSRGMSIRKALKRRAGDRGHVYLKIQRTSLIA